MSQTYQQRTHAPQRRASLFDHPVRPREKDGWKIEANCFRGFQADDQLKSARPLDRRVARTRTPQNLVDRSGRALHKLSIEGSVTQKGMGRREDGCPIKIDDRGQAFVHSKLSHDRHRLLGEKRRQQQAVPVVNQIRIYWWCSPPRIGRQRICPASSTARETGASFSKDKCVRTSL
jgi:hypothetical protein